MFMYEKKLQYPVKIARPNPKLAAVIISQYGGPDGELGASLRYLSQRYAMPYPELKGLLTDIGTEELGHLEMIGAIVHQLTRNLTDEQIQEMVSRGCLIGLNYSQDFLRTGSRPAVLDDLYRHAEHFLALGAERCLALGSDADGTDVPPGLNSPERFAGLYRYFLDRGLSTAQAEGILWKNALNFLKTHLFEQKILA